MTWSYFFHGRSPKAQEPLNIDGYWNKVCNIKIKVESENYDG